VRGERLASVMLASCLRSAGIPHLCTPKRSRKGEKKKEKGKGKKGRRKKKGERCTTTSEQPFCVTPTRFTFKEKKKEREGEEGKDGV